MCVSNKPEASREQPSRHYPSISAAYPFRPCRAREVLPMQIWGHCLQLSPGGTKPGYP